MTRYPTHLAFDRSRSAKITFQGEDRVVVNVHWVGAISVAQHLLVCPDSVGPDGPECKLCKGEEFPKTYPRMVALGWDERKSRWCIYVAPEKVFDEISLVLESNGVDMEAFCAGKGPPIILQREGMTTLVEIGSEFSSRAKQVRPKPPPLEDFLRGLQSRSFWAKHGPSSRV